MGPEALKMTSKNPRRRANLLNSRRSSPLKKKTLPAVLSSALLDQHGFKSFTPRGNSHVAYPK